jgi:hypothetical protein
MGLLDTDIRNTLYITTEANLFFSGQSRRLLSTSIDVPSTLSGSVRSKKRSLLQVSPDSSTTLTIATGSLTLSNLYFGAPLPGTNLTSLCTAGGTYNVLTIDNSVTTTINNPIYTATESPPASTHVVHVVSTSDTGTTSDIPSSTYVILSVFVCVFIIFAVIAFMRVCCGAEETSEYDRVKRCDCNGDSRGRSIHNHPPNSLSVNVTNGAN